ncbi:hypothetical protein O4J56_00140 [Nocardiopsis sp. RSe5-2]|uniref:ATP-binding protein n=1 Tax=Nocardiopsis endophytica TaxID=3018445 RepID=A0ABT4TWH4_9ACTN|nr:hypothetical protein [Nocardiopsis endophytica]MDA2809038.1 hypothetical protein [Nocardiopsis endophytica]
MRNSSSNNAATTLIQVGTSGDISVEARPEPPRGGDQAVDAALSAAVPVARADPRLLGVHPAPAGPGGSRLTPYIRRDRDGELEQAVAAAAATGGVVLVVGDSGAGKSRSLLHALASNVPHRRLVAPPTGTALDTLARRLVSPPSPFGSGVVVWLDDVDGFLEDEGAHLTEATLNLLTRGRTIVAMTLRTDYLDAHRALPPPPAHATPGPRRTVDLLRRLDPLLLERTWSAEETERAAGHGDPRLRTAAHTARHGVHGVAEYLAAGPLLVEIWQGANRCTDTGGHPRGRAVVSAAIDLYRTGLVSGLSPDLLRHTHTAYLHGAEALRPEGFDEALAWAQQVRLGASGLLVPADMDGGLWRPFDHLVASTHGPVPDEVRTRALVHALLEGNALDDAAPTACGRCPHPRHDSRSVRAAGTACGGHRCR